MPHITSALSINDATPVTPVVRSFVPRFISMEQSVFSYSRTAGDVPAKRVLVTVNWSDSSPKRPTVRQIVECTFPILRDDGTGNLAVAATGRSYFTHVIPDIMTEQEVNDMYAFALGANGLIAIKSGITTREPIWG